MAVVNGELKLIKNVDIFCVLSNLLDNAIEAQTFVDNKRVEVFIDENEDVCSLKIYNSISDDMVKAFKEDTLFNTHKKDKLMHGYGLKNVNDRMQLLYGMEYGIKVFSQIDQGTRVEMRIPREKADEEAVAAGEFSTKSFAGTGRRHRGHNRKERWKK